MGNFGFSEMAVIAIFGLLVFGPQRLPEIARSIGGFIREFKSVANGVTNEFKAELDAPAKVVKTPAPSGDQMLKADETSGEPAQANGDVPLVKRT